MISTAVLRFIADATVIDTMVQLHRKEEKGETIKGKGRAGREAGEWKKKNEEEIHTL